MNDEETLTSNCRLQHRYNKRVAPIYTSNIKITKVKNKRKQNKTYRDQKYITLDIHKNAAVLKHFLFKIRTVEKYYTIKHT